MAPKIREAPVYKPLPVKAEVVELDSFEEPPRKKQFKRSRQVLEGSNENTRDDTDGSQIGSFGNDGPPSHVNHGSDFSASDAFLAAQQEMKDYKEELEARVDEEKEKEIVKKIMKTAKREAQRDARLMSQEEGRREFERRKKMLRVQIEKELRPKIEKEIREMIEREKLEALESRADVGKERELIVIADD